MIAAIHQPNFLPWLGYFYKMMKADVFVFLDSVPFSKGGYTNRVKIKSNIIGPKWLTVPVCTKGKLGQLIKDVRCSHIDWREKIDQVIRFNYSRCPWFEDHWMNLFDIMCRVDSDNLSHMNHLLIDYIATELDIQTLLWHDHDFAVEGKSTELLINICKKLKADTYLSGSGGTDYQDEKAFSNAGIKLIYSDFKHPTYSQVPYNYCSFISGLSAVDLLFNYGSDSASILRGEANGK